jgi:hypothetical protein
MEEEYKMGFRERAVQLLKWLRLVLSDCLWCRNSMCHSPESFSLHNSDMSNSYASRLILRSDALASGPCRFMIIKEQFARV